MIKECIFLFYFLIILFLKKKNSTASFLLLLLYFLLILRSKNNIFFVWQQRRLSLYLLRFWFFGCWRDHKLFIHSSSYLINFFEKKKYSNQNKYIQLGSQMLFLHYLQSQHQFLCKLDYLTQQIPQHYLTRLTVNLQDHFYFQLREFKLRLMHYPLILVTIRRLFLGIFNL